MRGRTPTAEHIRTPHTPTYTPTHIHTHIHRMKQTLPYGFPVWGGGKVPKDPERQAEGSCRRGIVLCPRTHSRMRFISYRPVQRTPPGLTPGNGATPAC